MHDLHEGFLHAADVLIVVVEFFELVGGDVVGRLFACGCFSIEDEMGAAGEEVGAADKFEVVCYTVEGLELLVCYVEIDGLSHFRDFIRGQSSIIRHPSSVTDFWRIGDGPCFLFSYFFQT